MSGYIENQQTTWGKRSINPVKCLCSNSRAVCRVERVIENLPNSGHRNAWRDVCCCKGTYTKRRVWDAPARHLDQRLGEVDSDDLIAGITK